MNGGVRAWSLRSSVLGGIGWLVVLWISKTMNAPLGIIEQLFLLAPLVIVPLGFVLAAASISSDVGLLPYRAACFLQPFAAIGVIASFWFSSGISAALLVSGWLLVCGLVGFSGLERLFKERHFQPEDLCFDAGFLFLPVGGIWLFLSRSGATLFGVQEPITLLTGVHFHFTGFATPLIVAAAGRFLSNTSSPSYKLFRFVAAGVIGGTPLIAIGFVCSPLLKVVGVSFLTASLLLLSFLTSFIILPKVRPCFLQGMLAVSAGSLIVGMILASVYALGEFTGHLWISIPQMARVHGAINSIGFTLCGLIAWILLYPKIQKVGG